MESGPLNQAKSSIKRIVGMPEDRAELEKELLGDFEHFFSREDSMKYMLEKTAEQKQVLSEALPLLPQFLASYGLESYLPLEERQVMFLNIQKAPRRFAVMKEKGIYGFWGAQFQRIIMLDDYAGINHVRFLHDVAHEAVHANGFESLTAVVNEEEEKVDTKMRRAGLVTYIKEEGGKEDKKYFEAFNEAITEELTIRFVREAAQKIPSLAEDMEEFKDSLRQEYEKIIKGTKEGKKGFKDELIGVEFGNKERMVIKSNAGYSKERTKFRKMLKEIHEKNKEEFPTEEDVFKIFTKAYFSGKLLELARLIEKTYGKGSFRKLGKEGEKILSYNDEN